MKFRVPPAIPVLALAAIFQACDVAPSESSTSATPTKLLTVTNAVAAEPLATSAAGRAIPGQTIEANRAVTATVSTEALGASAAGRAIPGQPIEANSQPKVKAKTVAAATDVTAPGARPGDK